MGNIHIYAPKILETTVEENPKGWGMIKTECCRAKRNEGEYKEVTEYFEYHGPTVSFICKKNECDEKSKRDGRRTPTIYVID